MTPSYGIYSGYELCENQPMSDANEEYFESEKYEIKRRDFSQPGSLVPFVARINDIRRRHPAFSDLGNIAFHHSDNDQILCWSKVDRAADDVMLMVVNLDPHHTHEDTLGLDLPALGLRLARDLRGVRRADRDDVHVDGRPPLRAPGPGAAGPRPASAPAPDVARPAVSGVA